MNFWKKCLFWTKFSSTALSKSLLWHKTPSSLAILVIWSYFSPAIFFISTVRICLKLTMQLLCKLFFKGFEIILKFKFLNVFLSSQVLTYIYLYSWFSIFVSGAIFHVPYFSFLLLGVIWNLVYSFFTSFTLGVKDNYSQIQSLMAFKLSILDLELFISLEKF